MIINRQTVVIQSNISPIPDSRTNQTHKVPPWLLGKAAENKSARVSSFMKTVNDYRRLSFNLTSMTDIDR